MVLWQKTLIQHVLLGDCSSTVDSGEILFFFFFEKKTIKFESSRNRARRGLDILAKPDEDEFASDIPRDPKSVTLIT